MGLLDGKIAIITGGASPRGLGKERWSCFFDQFAALLR